MVETVRWYSNQFKKWINRPIFDQSNEFSQQYGEDGMCDKHKMSWLGSYYPHGCPLCFKDWYKEVGYLKLSPQGVPKI